MAKKFNHPVSHFEIPADDMDRARKFYSKVFGWEISAYSPEYFMAGTTEVDKNRMVIKHGEINGGIQKRGPRAKNPTVVLMTDSIEQSLKDVVAAGGKTAIAKEPIGDMGFYAQFDDSEGNRIGLFETM